MIEKILKKIVDSLNKEKEETPIVDVANANSQKERAKSADKAKDRLTKFIPKGDALANTNQVIDLVCDALQEYSLNSSIKIPAFSLYVSESGHDDLLRNILTALDFENKLRLKLTHKSIFTAADECCKWTFHFEKPQNEKAKEFAEGIFILYGKNEQPEASISRATLAQVTALKGELVKKAYLLDAKTEKAFNIGRGENPQLPNGSFHKNFVVIKDIEQQGHISRQHACILFDRQRGFCLKAEKVEKTFLFRDGKKIPLKENPTLQDGDQIKLCDNPNDIVLLFELVEENFEKMAEVKQNCTTIRERDCDE
ncbi:hypothetical protein AGMMS49525_15520 [Bacteroidia bacterium]|nr:hypothetical protein AGMMS49525_15520 [Bacteroidia bacterium]